MPLVNRFSRWSRISFALAFVALSTLTAVSDLPAQEDPGARLDAIVARYSQGDLERLWQGCRELEKLDDDETFVPWAQGVLETGEPPARLMAAKSLIALGSPERVDRTLRELIENAELASDLRAAAIHLLGNYSDEVNTTLLQSVLTGDEAFDAELRIAAARSLHQASPREAYAARSALAPLLKVDDPAVQAAAALTLGEMGLMDSGVKRILTTLEDEPTPQGAQARLLLYQDLLMRRLERATLDGARKPAEDSRRVRDLESDLKEQEAEINELKRYIGEQEKQTYPLLRELLRKIEGLYADPSRIDRQQLLIAAAKGMVSSLDPFSSFMDVKETNEFYESLSGEYAGIGAQVSKDPDSDYLLILRPIYNGPAYRMGLRSDDKITEVEGLSTQGLRIDEIIKVLKGEPGSPVKIKVFRRGWKDSRDYTIEREVIHIESVLYTMLPGDIGYIRLQQFGDTAVQEFESAAKDLEARGIRGMILDLRSNPGGYLTAAVDIVDYFVNDSSRPIVSQRGPSDSFPPQEHFATPGPLPGYPLVVLVNRSSASASEIVSGALQDFKRATVVGDKTFGKGSVQRLLTMPGRINELLGGDTTLRLTVQYYYLPTGRSIHTQRDKEGRITKEGGVEPDIDVAPETVALWRLEAVNALSDDGVFDEYLDKHFQEHEEQLTRIAVDGDGEKSEVYPGFEEFFEARNPHRALEEDIRYYLRAKIRARVQDARGKQFACDFPEDIQLQRAILEILEQNSTPPKDVPEYSFLAGKFDDAPEVKKN